MKLPPKATASAQTTVYFPAAAAKQATARISITGPAARDYVETQTIAAPSLVWSACNRTESLGVKSDVRIMAPPADQAKMAPDSIDGKVQLILGLQFRRC